MSLGDALSNRDVVGKDQAAEVSECESVKVAVSVEKQAHLFRLESRVNANKVHYSVIELLSVQL